MIRFHCTNCDQILSSPDTDKAKKAKCPKCESIIIIPDCDCPELACDDTDFPTPRIVPSYYSSDSLFSDTLKSKDEPKQPTQPQSSRDKTLEQLKELRIESGMDEPEPPPNRKLPWLLDIFLYPSNSSGMTILAILILIPAFINILAALVGPFGMFVVIPGIFVKIMLSLYLYWFFCECIRDSALGQLRAPDTTAITPAIGELFSQFFKLLACFVFFPGPMIIYNLYTGNDDYIFWLLVAYGVSFFPIAVLAMTMLDSYSALNPFFLIGSIFSAFLPYVALVLFFYAFVLFASLTFNPRLYWLLYIVLHIARIYLTLVAAHLLGRFYFKYQKNLNWDI